MFVLLRPTSGAQLFYYSLKVQSIHDRCWQFARFAKQKKKYIVISHFIFTINYYHRQEIIVIFNGQNFIRNGIIRILLGLQWRRPSVHVFAFPGFNFDISPKKRLNLCNFVCMPTNVMNDLFLCGLQTYKDDVKEEAVQNYLGIFSAKRVPSRPPSTPCSGKSFCQKTLAERGVT